MKGSNWQKKLKFPGADAFDLLFCHVAFGTPLQTREQRAERVRTDADFFKQYNDFGQYVLRTLLNKYSEHGPDELKIPDALSVPPISDHGNVTEIATSFGGDQTDYGMLLKSFKNYFISHSACGERK